MFFPLLSRHLATFEFTLKKFIQLQLPNLACDTKLQSHERKDSIYSSCVENHMVLGQKGQARLVGLTVAWQLISRARSIRPWQLACLAVEAAKKRGVKEEISRSLATGQAPSVTCRSKHDFCLVRLADGSYQKNLWMLTGTDYIQKRSFINHKTLYNYSKRQGCFRNFLCG